MIIRSRVKNLYYNSVINEIIVIDSINHKVEDLHDFEKYIKKRFGLTGIPRAFFKGEDHF